MLRAVSLHSIGRTVFLPSSPHLLDNSHALGRSLMENAHRNTLFRVAWFRLTRRALDMRRRDLVRWLGDACRC